MLLKAQFQYNIDQIFGFLCRCCFTSNQGDIEVKSRILITSQRKGSAFLLVSLVLFRFTGSPKLSYKLIACSSFKLLCVWTREALKLSLCCQSGCMYVVNVQSLKKNQHAFFLVLIIYNYLKE